MFDYELSGLCIVFKDTIFNEFPYISKNPRNHETLFMVTDGALLYETDEEKTIVKKGQVGYIPRGNKDSSSAYLCDSVSYIAINFSFSNSEESLFKTLPFDTVCVKNSTYYESLLTKAYNTYHSKLPAYQSLTKAVVLEIIGNLYNELMLSSISNKNLKTVETATDYIKKHYADPELKISDIAEVCNVSERNLRRLFISVHRKAPFAFLQEFRINQAEILLLSTSKPIPQIALQCGFSDLYAFSHCFKKHRRISPSICRNEDS